MQGFHVLQASFPCWLEGSEANFLHAISEIQVLRSYVDHPSHSTSRR